MGMSGSSPSKDAQQQANATARVDVDAWIQREELIDLCARAFDDAMADIRTFVDQEVPSYLREAAQSGESCPPPLCNAEMVAGDILAKVAQGICDLAMQRNRAMTLLVEADGAVLAQSTLQL